MGELKGRQAIIDIPGGVICWLIDIDKDGPYWAQWRAYRFWGSKEEGLFEGVRKLTDLNPWGIEWHESDNETMRGSIKWDGCRDIQMNAHFCGHEQQQLVSVILGFVESFVRKTIDRLEWEDEIRPYA